MSTDPPLSEGTTRWIRCTSQGSVRPSARVQHSFTLDDLVLKNPTDGQRYRAFLYGGRTQWTAAPDRDTLWTAWFMDSATVQLQNQAASGTWPGKRARHGALDYQPGQQLVLMGGCQRSCKTPQLGSLKVPHPQPEEAWSGGRHS